MAVNARRFSMIFFLILALILVGCQNRKKDQGIAAVVNGEVIGLQELKASYDFIQTDHEDPIPVLEHIQEDYGEVLAGLIVQTLIRQDLARRGLAVEDQDVRSAEDAVRADYPEGTFEQVLLEECVDIDDWRQGLRARLEIERLYQEVLRPRIRMEPEEIRSYYQSHGKDFVLPEQIVLFMVRGSQEEETRQGAKDLAESKDVEKAVRMHPALEFKKGTLSLDRLGPEWKAVLEDLPPWESGQVLAEGKNYLAFVAVERISGGPAPLAQAYNVIEKTLVEKKMAEAFGLWLRQAVDTASIEVNAALAAGHGSQGINKQE